MTLDVMIAALCSGPLPARECAHHCYILSGHLSVLLVNSRQVPVESQPHLAMDEMCLHGFVRRHARVTPDAIAVSSGSSWLTYRGLERRSGRLAVLLRRRGVRLESVVGVCLERSVDFVVAAVAILKAGGTYLPLDVSYPAERLGAMVGDAAPAIVVTDSAHAGLISPGTTELLLLDRLDAEDVPPGEVHALPATHPDNLAVVLYTSGSTGRPKGVCLTHRSIAEMVGRPNYASLGPGDRMAQIASPSFDAAAFETWSALACGGGLVILPQEEVADPEALVTAIADRAVTIAAPTSALVNQKGHCQALAAAPLRFLLFGGESVNAEAVRTLVDGGFPGHLVHIYGPTEAAMFATFEVVSELPERHSRVPIGRPVCASEPYLLDHRLRPVPADIPAQIVIGGSRLARCYLGSPRTTADRFRPNPFPHRPGERVYHTGDLARFLPDGRLEFLGRMDRQVKVSGVRIEPGEVEAALLALPGIAAAAVRARENAEGRLSLVGYVAREPGAEITVSGVRAVLARRLPAHFIPSVVMVLDQLPLTANGKVDDAALPVPAARGGAIEPGRRPTGETQVRIAEVWCDVLGVEEVAADDDFFALGGHSLLAFTMLSTVSAHFGVDVPIGQLVASPTLAALADLVEAARSAGPDAARSDLRVIRQLSGGPTLVLIHPVGGSVFAYGPLIEFFRGNCTVLAFEAVRPTGETVPRLAARYLDELLGARPDGPVVLAGWSMGGVIAQELAVRWEKRDGTRAPVVMIDAANPVAQPRQASSGEAKAIFLEDLFSSLGLARDELTEDHLTAPWADVVASITALKPDDASLRLLTEADLLTRFQLFVWLYDAFHQHTPTPYAGPVHLIHTRGHADMATPWASLCDTLEVLALPGDHYTILWPPIVDSVAARIKDAIEKASTTTHQDGTGNAHSAADQDHVGNQDTER
ncbi:amino acid adenylation domain-containing protein [Streptomyces sp. Ag109_G2-15]|uniref:amino acid adenylation domain-containing protein n=1 Tax=Streptomyces sp. Ag109_G2-15 TaxID=1938850 RepID=UPI000BDC4D1D|nr:amino acid adenylation domain-containing protein [Streptomyces sp. Ag109_G2-15]SOD91586.1 amino acid adenylation domain-containing protein [Streptomyces sp. Ag109_G2-15]